MSDTNHQKLETWIYKRVARKQNIAYALLDENFIVLTSNSALKQWTYQEVTSDLKGQFLPDLFPELIGLEETLHHLRPNQSEPFIIPTIYRLSPQDSIAAYFDLEIIPFFEFGAALLITVTNVTQQAQLEQQLQQQRNELRLNIIERKRIEKALRQSEERYAVAVRGANDGLWDWDLQTNELYFSPRWKAMLGYAEDEIDRNSEEWFKRVHPQDLPQLKAEIKNHLQGEFPHLKNEYRLRHKDGAYRWMLCRGLAVRGERGYAYRMAGSQTDITQRKAAEKQLLHHAFHDNLTGLINRAMFTTRLARLIAQTRQNPDYMFAVLFLDLDRFKVINDSLGHLVGDQLLITVARRLEACVRPEDTVARLGGDEFTILLHNLRHIGEARRVAERIQQELALPIDLGERKIVTKASIGIVLNKDKITGQMYEQPGDLLRDADTAMYRAKALGKGRYETFDAGMRVHTVASLELETELHQALERQQFELHYQPMISLLDGQVTSVEALLRWQHPRRNILPLKSFISLAEETGLILPLGEWLLRTACNQLRAWHVTGHTSLQIAVNVSPRQLQQQNLVKLVKEILAETGLAANDLILEIIESTVVMNDDFSLTTLSQLSTMGVNLAIDDFGLGSSLGLLKHFPVNAVKIDHAFVSTIFDNESKAATVIALITMAHSLKIKIIAAGVEHINQLAFLHQHGCDEVQGRLFNWPILGQEFTQFLQSNWRLDLSDISEWGGVNP